MNCVCTFCVVRNSRSSCCCVCSNVPLHCSSLVCHARFRWIIARTALLGGWGFDGGRERRLRICHRKSLLRLSSSENFMSWRRTWSTSASWGLPRLPRRRKKAYYKQLHEQFVKFIKLDINDYSTYCAAVAELLRYQTFTSGDEIFWWQEIEV